MSLHARPQLNSARRRSRKAQIAARDGWRCAYCRHRFRDLREATMDHVVPISLYRTWSVSALVLACLPCNRAKADRLFLSLALLLVWSADPTFTGVQPTNGPTGRAFTADGSAFTGPDRSADSDPIRLRPEEVDWLMLARLVHARSTTARSTPDQTKHQKSEQRGVRVGRLDSHRRTARMNTCERSTDRGVSA
ncbi:HNH endonuclease [Streptomyces showdoensis]|uniref:HNH endonuclease n=1 Tax=Streptomyces showdoensis TaxID=68268 RepID=UPI000F4F6278|nr:HNH endonuclease signature motif containing protein [Streptomyces showdoensis]